MKPCKAENDEYRVLETKTLEQKIAGYKSPRIDLVQYDRAVTLFVSDKGELTGYRVKLAPYFGTEAAFKQLENADQLIKEELSHQRLSEFLATVTISLQSYRPKVGPIFPQGGLNTESVASIREANDSEAQLLTRTGRQTIVDQSASIEACPRFGSAVSDFQVNYNGLLL